MNRRLKEIQISLKNLKTKIPTSNESLDIRVHWDNDFTFEVKIPLNNISKRR